MIDSEKLVKLLMLSTSDSDGEALSALRHANRMIKKENLTWIDVIKKGSYKKKQVQRQQQKASPPTKPPPPKPEPPKQEDPKEEQATKARLSADDLAKIFTCLMESEKFKQSSSFEFLKSVFDYWGKNSRISEKQETIVLEIYRRFKKLK